MQHLHKHTTPPKRPWRFEPTERISERKRALFPSQDNDSDSDLGHISPLENSSSPERYEHLNISQSESIDFRYFTFFDDNKSDENDENCDPNRLQINDVFVSASSTPTDSPTKKKDSTFVPETPIKSPTDILKTPQENSSTNLQLPRLVRKSLLDISNIDKSNLKRKSDSPIENANNKCFKLDHSASKPPKARTALFTDSESIFPAKSFYPKVENNKHDISFRSDLSLKSQSTSKKPAPVYLCNRSKNKNNKKYFGQINAGVRHGIKKPKRKPALSKTQLLKAALSIIKNSPLNEYLDSNSEDVKSPKSENECGVSLDQIQKMDSILKNIDTRTNIKPIKTEYPFSATNKLNCPPKIETTFGLKRLNDSQVDSPRKFFKSDRSRATITINDNIKLNLNHGELSLIERQNKIPKPKQKIIDFDMSDFSFNEDNIIEESFTNIIKSLEDDTPTTISTTTTENNASNQLNSVQGKFIEKPKITNDMLLSPTSLMCDMTSGLALDSPKSQITQNAELDLKASFKKRISFPENTMDKSDNKLYPIFYGKQNSIPKVEKKESRHVKNIRKIWKPLSEDQTLIDAGQKKFGAVQCSECKIIYSVGEPEDELMHYRYHNSIHIFRYNGWKHERIVNQFQNGKIIQINPNDPKSWWKKIRDLTEVINRELGFVDIPFVYENKKVFLYIINKQIVGCLISEPKTQAYKMLPSNGVDQCSEELYPIKCGVSRIWVAASHRKKGIATSLMNSMRSHFVYGHILSINEIGFSAPTDAGKKFAEKYTKINNFFIYTS